MQYRKKPIAIEAFQMTTKTFPRMEEWPEWLVSAWIRGQGEGGFWLDPIADVPDIEKYKGFCLGTLEGVMVGSWDDYIIQGVQGEVYACKPDIFEQTYEPVTGTD